MSIHGRIVAFRALGRRAPRLTGSPGAVTLAAMKIATWNVNSVRARLPRVLDWLEQERPDVALLQEIK